MQAVLDGVSKPIDWHDDITQRYMDANATAKEVIYTAEHYGIKNGVTLPLLSSETGIAGAIFISNETTLFSKMLNERLETLSLCSRLFHEMVHNNTLFRKEFVKPLVESLSRTELRYLIGMCEGKSHAKITLDLGRSEGYLEQVMLKIRRKFSGVAPDQSPSINRNQLLYYAGLLEIIEYEGE